MNKVILIGRLGGDPQTTTFGNMGEVTKVTLATTQKWTSKSGEPREETQWHNLSFWGKLSEIAKKYLEKGDLISVVGQIKYGSYEKEGVKHYTTEIKVEEMKMLSGKSNNNTEKQQHNQATTPPQPQINQNSEVDDLPF